VWFGPVKFWYGHAVASKSAVAKRQDNGKVADSDIGTGGEPATATAEDAWPRLESFLANAARQAAVGAPATITIRELLADIEAERRGTRVVGEIQEALERHGLITEPPFTSGWIDNVVELRKVPPLQENIREHVPASQTAADHSRLPEIALSVSSLRSAGAGAVVIERNDTLERARALMLRYDYSQLAVTSGPRRLIGAVSWESMARAAIRHPDLTLRHAIISSTPVAQDDDLIALIPTIIEQGFVFVTSPDHTLGGIVTTADLSNQFGTLAKPFLLLGEIERRLRHVLTLNFKADELTGLSDPSDGDRAVDSAHNLTLGEIVRCLENAQNWQRLSWPVDRAEFISALHAVREIRNDVMHFSPDPLTPAQDSVLQNFARWLRVMEPSP
jgi:restriction system protein